MNEQTTLPKTPFSTGWWSFDLGKYRPCNGTYCLYSYENLPPIPALDGTFNWLMPLPEDLNKKMERYRDSSSARSSLKTLIDEARERQLILPDSFVYFMSSVELQNRIPSCTACYFEPSLKIAPCPGTEDGYVIRFFNDQQDCILWHLYLTPEGEQCVLASSFRLDEDFSEYDDLTPEAVINNTVICAPSFEAFIYRCWLENTIWFALNSGTPLTHEQQQYVDAIS